MNVIVCVKYCERYSLFVSETFSLPAWAVNDKNFPNAIFLHALYVCQYFVITIYSIPAWAGYRKTTKSYIFFHILDVFNYIVSN